MTVGFEPSVEMIEAGARALCETASDGIDNYDDLDDVAQEMFREWSEANLRAALGLVLSDPCPTCANRGTIAKESLDPRKMDPYSIEVLPCPNEEWHNSNPGPVWAWLRAAQNSGVMEQAGVWAPALGIIRSGSPIADTADWPFPKNPPEPLFRVSVPSTPEES